MNDQPDGRPNLPGAGTLSDLEWTAFCFLTDELDSLERTRFEEMLENNTAACEALASMVELLQQGSQTFESNFLNSSSKSNSAQTELSADSCGPETVSEPCESYSISPTPLNEFVDRQARTKAWRFWTSTCAIVLLVSILGYYLSRPINESVEPIADVWAGQLDDSNDLLAEDDATEATSEIESAEESEEDWLFTALVSLEEWPSNEYGE